jgi:hypothetical protein
MQTRRHFLAGLAPACFALAGGAPRTHASVPPELRLASLAARFRLEGCGDFAATCRLKQKDASVFAKWFSPAPAPNRPPVWEGFMATTIVLAGAMNSVSPVTGFYNPFFDAVLLTAWNLEQERVVRASLLPGEFLRSGRTDPSVAAPAWTRAEGKFDLEIRRFHGLSEDSFARLFPPRHPDLSGWSDFPRETDYRIALERLLLRSLVGLTYFQRRGTAPQVWLAKFREALGGEAAEVAGAFAGCPPALITAIASLPAAHRRNLRPLAHFGAGGNHHLFWQDPLQPKFFLATLVREGPPIHLRNASWLALDRIPPPAFTSPKTP